ncbi:hypothetical protein J2S74_004229 [Evansella vedderi]|uniref:Uncharacterized protein n=1 Tax=Evansella vedderi TaxID=38282 RepID=A0ABT9ZZZ5_9BACI|nr:hypothetical protein [Evansella vedderi]MDQ0256807.1 hypothetical protein [Evansella vedderi]
MGSNNKDTYFQKRDRLIKSLPEPERSVYGYFRQVEKANLEEHGKLVVNGKTPMDLTAEHFNMELQETKQCCLRAVNILKEWTKL